MLYLSSTISFWYSINGLLKLYQAKGLLRTKAEDLPFLKTSLFFGQFKNQLFLSYE